MPCMDYWVNGKKFTTQDEFLPLLKYPPGSLSAGHYQCLCFINNSYIEIERDLWFESIDDWTIVLTSPEEFGWHSFSSQLDEEPREPEIDGVQNVR